MTEIEQAQAMLANRLKKNLRRLGDWARRAQITSWRAYDSDIPELPLYIDWYEGQAHVALLARRRFDEFEEWNWLEALGDTVAEVLEIPRELVFTKTRRRSPGQTRYRKFADQEVRHVVHEGGLKFYVNLSDYIDTGLFLDHRITRDMVRAESAGKRVLNLFAYTGAFSVYAAHGGARQVVTMDMSRTYLNWAEDNFRLNGLDPGAHRFDRSDLMAFLRQPHRVGERFDLAVLDPPTYSQSKRMEETLELQRDHVYLIQRTLELLRPGGVLYFSNNFRAFALEADRLTLAGGIEEITERTTPRDFERTRPHRAWRIVRK